MAYLIGQLILPLLAAVVGGGMAGWSWHCIRTRDDWAARDGERDRLRNELLSYIGAAPADHAIHLGAGENEALQLRVEAANEQALALQRELAHRDEVVGAHQSRIAELEMALASAQSELRDRASPQDDPRLAQLEQALHDAETKAADLDRRAVELQAALDRASASAPPEVDVAALRWRIRELESRLAQHADTAIAPVAAPLAAPVAASVERPDLEDALLRRGWQARYLQARVNYLEGVSAATAAQPAPAPAPVVTVDEEADNRRRWRQRYLEARVAWLEGRARDHGDMRARLEADVAARDTHIESLGQHIGARDTRIAALEADLSSTPAEDARIAPLTQRVAELEGALTASRAETTHAARRVADLEAGLVTRDRRIAELEAAPKPQADPAGESSLRWRSRYLDSRVRHLEQTLAVANQAPPAPPPTPRDDSFRPIAPQGAEVRPQGLPAPRAGAADDLRLIDGVGPRIESTLHSLGVFHFDQIAAWTPANIDWIERYLAFKGRIGRERWVEQARVLADNAAARRPLEGEPV